MTIDKAILLVASLVVLASVGLAVTIDLNWLWLTGFMGLNLVQASITGFCPGALLFKKLGMQPGCAFYGKKAEGACCCGDKPKA